MLVVRKTILWGLLLLVSSVYAQYPLLLKDINLQADPLATSATLGSDPRFLTNHNGILYFTAKQNGSTVGLWKSSGRNATTVKVLDLPGTAYALTSVGSYCILWRIRQATATNFGNRTGRPQGRPA